MISAFLHPPAIVSTIEETEGGGSSPQLREDPWEGMNRRLYGASEFLDKVAVRPLAMTYRRILPRPVRNGVHNALENLDEPRIAVDHLLQGKVVRAGGGAARFATNSTIGLFGLFDVAKNFGLPRHETDFGITLGRMHVGAGPYVYVPVLGPSSARDLIGNGVDFALDPLNWIPFRDSTTVTNTTTVVEGLDTRARIDAELTGLKRGAVDPYATIRSIYTQLRESEVRGGTMDVMDLPAFPDEAPPPEAETPQVER